MFQIRRSPAVGGSFVCDVEWRSPSGDVIVPSLVRYQLYAVRSDGSSVAVTDPRTTDTLGSVSRIELDSHDLRTVDGATLMRFVVVEGYYNSDSGSPLVDRETVEFTLSAVPAVSDLSSEPDQPVEPVQVELSLVKDDRLSDKWQGVVVTSTAPASLSEVSVVLDPKYLPPVYSPLVAPPKRGQSILGMPVDSLFSSLFFLLGGEVHGSLLPVDSYPGFGHEGVKAWFLPVCVIKDDAEVVEVLLDGESLGQSAFSNTVVVRLLSPARSMTVLLDGIPYAWLDLSSLVLHGYESQELSPMTISTTVSEALAVVESSLDSVPASSDSGSGNLPVPAGYSELEPSVRAGSFSLGVPSYSKVSGPDTTLIVPHAVLRWGLGGFYINVTVYPPDGEVPGGARLSRATEFYDRPLEDVLSEIGVPSKFDVWEPLVSNGGYTLTVPVEVANLSTSQRDVLLFDWYGDGSSLQTLTLYCNSSGFTYPEEGVAFVHAGGRFANVSVLSGSARIKCGSGSPVYSSMVVEAVSSTLGYVDADPSIGRSHAGWYFGVQVFFPDRQDISNAVLMVSDRSGSFVDSYRVADLNEGPDHFWLWSGLTEEDVASGTVLVRTMVIDWTGDGGFMQTITVVVDPAKNDLLARGEVLLSEGVSFGNVTPLTGSASLVVDTSAVDSSPDLPSCTLTVEEAYLPFELADPSIGRYKDASWAGFRLDFPQGVDLRATRVSYSSSSDPSMFLDVSMDDIKDNDGFVTFWSPVYPSTLEDVERQVRVNWVLSSGDSYIQHVGFVVDVSGVIVRPLPSTPVSAGSGFTPSDPVGGVSLLTGGGHISVQDGSVLVEVDHAVLDFAPADPSIGRMKAGWWLGIRVMFPSGWDSSTASLGVYNSLDVSSSDKAYRLDAVKDSPDHVDCWIPVPDSSSPGVDFGRRYEFSWGGGLPSKIVTVKSVADRIVRIPDGKVFVDMDGAVENVTLGGFSAVASISEGTSPADCPDIEFVLHEGFADWEDTGWFLHLYLAPHAGADLLKASYQTFSGSSHGVPWAAVVLGSDGRLDVPVRIQGDVVELNVFVSWDGSYKDLQSVALRVVTSNVVLRGGLVPEPDPSPNIGPVFVPAESVPGDVVPQPFVPSEQAKYLKPEVSTLSSLQSFLLSWESLDAGYPVVLLTASSYTGTETKVAWDYTYGVALS